MVVGCSEVLKELPKSVFFFFFQIVDDRSAETLIPIISKFIKKGSIIHSNCWKSYSCLEAEGYSHFTVNHSKEFVDSETGTRVGVKYIEMYLSTSSLLIFKYKYKYKSFFHQST